MEKSFGEQFEKAPQDLGAAAVKKLVKEKDIIDELVEEATKSAFGENVFEKEEPRNLKIVKSGDIKPEYKDAVDQQIEKFEKELNKIKEKFNVIKRKGTPEQIEERQKRIEFLKEEIEKAKKAKNFGAEARVGKKTGKMEVSKQKIEKKETAQSLTQKILEIRMTGREGEKVDELLRSNGIEPNTLEADRFMKIWDGMLARNLIKTKKDLSEQEIAEAIKNSLEEHRYEKPNKIS